MDAAAILATLRARGATARRVGDRLSVSPRDVLDDELCAAIRAEPERILELVSVEPPAPEPRAEEAAGSASASLRCRYSSLPTSSGCGERRHRWCARPSTPSPSSRTCGW